MQYRSPFIIMNTGYFHHKWARDVKCKKRSSIDGYHEHYEQNEGATNRI